MLRSCPTFKSCYSRRFVVQLLRSTDSDLQQFHAVSVTVSQRRGAKFLTITDLVFLDEFMWRETIVAVLYADPQEVSSSMSTNQAELPERSTHAKMISGRPSIPSESQILGTFRTKHLHRRLEDNWYECFCFEFVLHGILSACPSSQWKSSMLWTLQDYSNCCGLRNYQSRMLDCSQLRSNASTEL